MVGAIHLGEGAGILIQISLVLVFCDKTSPRGEGEVYGFASKKDCAKAGGVMERIVFVLSDLPP